jgi:hypothetical protein
MVRRLFACAVCCDNAQEALRLFYRFEANGYNHEPLEINVRMCQRNLQLGRKLQLFRDSLAPKAQELGLINFTEGRKERKR